VNGNILDKKIHEIYTSRWSYGFMKRAFIFMTETAGALDNLFNVNFRKFLRQIAGFWYDTKMFYIKVYIKISVGCTGNCSYCAIKNAKGNVKSKPIDCLISEFRRGLSLGYNEFVLRNLC